jgi:lactoylglutathione lyase
MILNHINLTVSDVQATKAFLETYFGMRCAEGDEERKNFVAMFDDSNLVLTLMTGGRSTEIKYPGTFHIGFVQESETKVNEIYQRLKEDGFEVEAPQRHHAWTFYVMAPGGFSVEVMA